MTTFNFKKPWMNRSHHSPTNPVIVKDKKQTIIADIQNAKTHDIQTEAGTIRFRDGYAVLPNDGRATEIYSELKAKHARHPDHFAMIKDREGVKNWIDPTHNYTFGSHPAMPWAKYDDRGRRIFDGDTEQGKREAKRSGQKVGQGG